MRALTPTPDERRKLTHIVNRSIERRLGRQPGLPPMVRWTCAVEIVGQVLDELKDMSGAETGPDQEKRAEMAPAGI